MLSWIYPVYALIYIIRVVSLFKNSDQIILLIVKNDLIRVTDILINGVINMINHKALGWGIGIIFVIGLAGCASKSGIGKSDSANPGVQQINTSNQINQVDIESSTAKSPILISSPEITSDVE